MLPVDDFPVMDEDKLEIEIKVKSKNFKNLVNNCKFCMGLDESRQYLNGIYLHSNGETVSTVATDGQADFPSAHFQSLLSNRLME